MVAISGDLSDQLGLKVEQQRELRDDIVPSLSWRRFRNRVPAITGMFHFSMQAAWTDHSESEIHGFIYARPITPELSIDATLPPFTGVVSETNGWITSFQLDRKGIVTLDWGNCDADSILEIIDSEFFNVSAQEAQDRLTFQTYLFLKDFIHSHKFHNGDDDSILVPYRIETDDDVSWYDKTARNLHASIVTAMRGRRFDVLNAMGQISYLDAFLQLRSGANPGCHAARVDAVERASDIWVALPNGLNRAITPSALCLHPFKCAFQRRMRPHRTVRPAQMCIVLPHGVLPVVKDLCRHLPSTRQRF